MPFIADGRTLIQRAFEGRYALPAFNVCSLEMIVACVEAAELERAPIMIQTAPGDLQHLTPEVAASIVKVLAERASIPVMLHRDHGEDLAAVSRSLRAGYSSAMFDGEALPLEENIRHTKNLAAYAHAAGASLEAAGGSFGGGEAGASSEVHLTDPEVAARLHAEGDADMVACSVGSVHGHSSTLDLERLEAIYNAARKPLVLHGGTGIPAEDLAEAVKLGVVKVNIGAGLARAVLRAKSYSEGDHYDFYAAARDEIREVAREKIRMMKASGKA